MSTGKRVALILPVLVTAGIVAQNYSSRVTGDFPGADFGMFPLAFANISSAEPSAARAYYVSWGSCTNTPDYHNVCVSVAGLAPKSAVNFEQAESMTVDLDVPTLTVLFSATGQDCSMAGCVSFVPSSVPLKGTLAAYSGPGSSLEELSGNTHQVSTFSFGETISTMSTTFIGNRTTRSARFSGIVGSVTIQSGALGSEGHLYMYRGQQVTSSVYSQ